MAGSPSRRSWAHVVGLGGCLLAVACSDGMPPSGEAPPLEAPPNEGTLTVGSGLAAVPGSVLGIRIVMTRAAGGSCGSALTSFDTGCIPAATPRALSGLCSGQWSIDSTTTKAFADAACTTEIPTLVTQTPAPAAVGYATSAAAAITFKGVFSIDSVVVVTGGGGRSASANHQAIVSVGAPVFAQMAGGTHELILGPAATRWPVNR